MTFQIFQNFKVVVVPNKLNTIVKEITQFEYMNDEMVTQKSGLKYEVLKKIYEGDLLPFVEYQIIATLPIFIQDQKNKNNIEFFGVPVIEIEEFSELEGDNPIRFPFLRVIE